MTILSNYQHNASASTKRKWYVSILDHMTCFVVTILLFFLVAMILDLTPLVKNAQDRVVDAQTQLNDIVLKSHLDKMNDNNVTLLGCETITKNYLKSLVYNSLKDKEEENRLSNSVYTEDIRNSTLIDYDAFYYYELEFKKNNISDFEDGVVIDYNLIKEYTSTDYWIEETYPYLLKEEQARSIDGVLTNNYKNDDLTVYNTLFNGYYNLLRNRIEEVTKSYRPYVEQYKIYENNASQIFYIRHYELLISYLLAIIIVYFIIPLFFKDGITLSMKAFKQAIKRKDNSRYSLLNALCRVIYNMFKNLLLLPIVFLILYSISARPLFVTSLIFNIPLVFYPIFSGIIIITSLVLSLLTKTDKEMLDEILFRYRIVDINEYENEDYKEKIKNE